MLLPKSKGNNNLKMPIYNISLLFYYIVESAIKYAKVTVIKVAIVNVEYFAYRLKKLNSNARIAIFFIKLFNI